jgi:hypothetical protein
MLAKYHHARERARLRLWAFGGDSLHGKTTFAYFNGRGRSIARIGAPDTLDSGQIVPNYLDRSGIARAHGAWQPIRFAVVGERRVPG